MTPRAEVSYNLMTAYSFATTALESGYKYKRAVTCLTFALDLLNSKLTQQQITSVFSKVEKDAKKKKFGYYDYLDLLSRSIEIISRGKDRYINSLVALASNVEEISKED